MYAQLCKLLSDKCETFKGKGFVEQASGAPDADADNATNKNPFRLALLAHCRDLFATKRSEKIADIMNDASLSAGD